MDEAYEWLQGVLTDVSTKPKLAKAARHRPTTGQR